MNNRRPVAFAAALAILVMPSCGFEINAERPPLRPPPDGVPAQPSYRTVDVILERLDEEGLPCVIVRRSGNNDGVGEQLTCDMEINGLPFQSDIHAYNLKKLAKAEVDDAIASRLEAPFRQTLVAAGNWYVRVFEPRYADRVALALNGVVLSGEEDPPSVTTPTPTSTR